MIESITLIIALMVAPWAKHPLVNNEKARVELATEIVEASDEYEIDPVLLTVWAFYESSFIKTSVGKIGETGYMQTMGVVAKKCEKNGIKSDSIACGAFTIRNGIKKCGSLEKSLWWYSSPGYAGCNGTPAAKRATKYRLRKVEQWRTRIK
jgi:hypothetical protein